MAIIALAASYNNQHLFRCFLCCLLHSQALSLLIFNLITPLLWLLLVVNRFNRNLVKKHALALHICTNKVKKWLDKMALFLFPFIIILLLLY